MAAEDVSAGISAERRALAAVLFMQAATMTMDVYSALNSSPWTSENFGANEEKAASSRFYVRHAVGSSMAFALGSSFIGGSLVPVLAAGVANAYMWYLYERALRRGAVSGSDGWAKS